MYNKENAIHHQRHKRTNDLHRSVIHEALVESELSARYDVEDRMLCLSLRWGRRDVLRHACIYVALGGRVSIYGLRSLGRV